MTLVAELGIPLHFGSQSRLRDPQGLKPTAIGHREVGVTHKGLDGMTAQAFAAVGSHVQRAILAILVRALTHVFPRSQAQRLCTATAP